MALFDLPLDQLERYRSTAPSPDDFDEFWAASLMGARRRDVLVDVVPVATGLTLVETWDVTFAGFDGHPVRAWYTRPAGVSDDLPGVVEYLGYGRGILDPATYYYRRVLTDAGRVYQARTGCPSNPANVTSHVSTSVSPVATGTTSTRTSCRRASRRDDAQNASKSAGSGTVDR